MLPPFRPDLWRPKRRKNYPHFDGHLNDVAIDALVKSPGRVQRNPFFPFIVFKKKFNRFGITTPRNAREKIRQLRYAARKDAYIYEFYRQIISVLYENQLQERGLTEVVIAYRKPKRPDGRGKCSIDFARDAFAEIASRSDCVALALDVSSYFESLDHKEIKRHWCNLLGQSKLPDDHFAVYQSITRYSQIDRDEVYRRLGIMAWDASLGRWKYTKSKAEIPLQLCSIADFRSKIAMPKGAIWTNPDSFGIPQGSPISDLIANFYLLDFDETLLAYAQSINGIYRRYCDDILIIYSDKSVSWGDVESFIQGQIRKFGAKLEIKGAKTCVHAFSQKSMPYCKSLKGDERRFEYLGFQFDGKEARFRDKTVSGFYRKLKWSIFSEVRAMTRRYPGKSAAFVEKKLDASLLMQRFGRKKGFSDCADVRDWTFWTYVHRSSETMGLLGPNLFKQISNYRRFVRSHLATALVDAFTP
ncbi:MAG: hypothetical protein RJB58_441 [Pseudomonadota bacterium]